MIADLERREASLEEREVAVTAREEAGATQVSSMPTVERSAPDGPHLLFVPGERYTLEERTGKVPERGATVLHDEAAFVVTRIGPSPLPGDPRPCVFLSP